MLYLRPGADPELLEMKAMVEGQSWQAVAAALIAANTRSVEEPDLGGVQYLKDAAFPYYLPAFLIASLELLQFELDLVYNTIADLDPSAYISQRKKLEMLSSQEASAVQAFLNMSRSIGPPDRIQMNSPGS